VCIKIKNRSSLSVRVVILDLQPDWGITQVFPFHRESPYYRLDPGETLRFSLQGQLPQGFSDATDEIMLIGTLSAVDFGWLELAPLSSEAPAINEADSRKLSIEGSPKPLSAKPRVKANRHGSSMEEWTVVRARIRIRHRESKPEKGCSRMVQQTGDGAE